MELSELIKTIRILEFSTNKTVDEVFAGNYKSAFKGRGVEFADIRKYDEGDDYRDIDWNTSARQGELYVKTYHESREVQTMVVMDVSSSMNFTSTGKTKKKVALELLAMISFSTLKNNDKVGAFFFNSEIESLLMPKKGQGNVWAILREALLHTKDNFYKQTSALPILRKMMLLFRKRTIIFWICDEFSALENETFRKQFQTLGVKHDVIVIRIIDPLEKGLPEKGLYHIEDPETGKKKLVDLSSQKLRTQFIQTMNDKFIQEKKSLSSIGIDCLDIQTDQSLYQKMFAFFKTRQSRY